MNISNCQLEFRGNILCNSSHCDVCKLTEISRGIACLVTLPSDALLDKSFICSISQATVFSCSFILAICFATEGKEYINSYNHADTRPDISYQSLCVLTQQPEPYPTFDS